jgi:GTP cyclohydrolase I
MTKHLFHGGIKILVAAPHYMVAPRGVQKNRVIEKTEKTDGKLIKKTEPR